MRSLAVVGQATTCLVIPREERDDRWVCLSKEIGAPAKQWVPTTWKILATDLRHHHHHRRRRYHHHHHGPRHHHHYHSIDGGIMTHYSHSHTHTCIVQCTEFNIINNNFYYQPLAKTYRYFHFPHLRLPLNAATPMTGLVGYGTLNNCVCPHSLRVWASHRPIVCLDPLVQCRPTRS